jgi:preprotein translocase subunit SecA
MAGRGTDIMLGGNPEFAADLQLRQRGITPAESPEEYEAAWPAALEKSSATTANEHDEVVELGGLYVLGTERHESRRIDNQLRGRSGRQGDPGESRFYLSLGDDLMRRFNATTVEAIMTRLNIPDDQPIEAKMVSRAIRSAQTQVEQQNFEIRKNVLKYDEVMNRQREVIYAERRRVLNGADLHEQVQHMIDDVVTAYISGATAEGYPEDWDLDQLWTALKTLYPATVTVDDVVKQAGGELSGLSVELLLEEVKADAHAAYDAREEQLGSEVMRELERKVVLSVLDRKWREHLYEMDYMQEGIGLRAMAQRDPLVEYKREGFEMFSAMLDGIKEESVGYLFNVDVQVDPEEVSDPAQAGVTVIANNEPTGEISGAVATANPSQSVDGNGAAGRGAHRDPEPVPAGPAINAKGLAAPGTRADGLQYSAPTLDSEQEQEAESANTTTVTGSGPSRNAPCPCGSGKKYKRCHGAPTPS